MPGGVPVTGVRALHVMAPMLLAACSGGSNSGQDCDAIASEIRDAAAKRGISSVGVCTSTNPAIQKDFASACQSLKDCNAGK